MKIVFFLTFRLAASSEGKAFPSDEAARRNVRKKTILKWNSQSSEILVSSKSWVGEACLQWGLCALRHDIQISMEANLACHPARSTEWLDCHPKSCELWRIRTGPIGSPPALRTGISFHSVLSWCTLSARLSCIFPWYKWLVQRFRSERLWVQFLSISKFPHRWRM